ncbi:MAG: hypothetical protein P8M12_09480 [Flavobacteriales bacterium]|jgi:hypothetical protein|nr:hypothetical protein [Flavobacteriales bacterium]
MFWRNTILTFIFIFGQLTVFSTINYSFNTPPSGVNYHLAISINPGHNNSYINFAIISENNGKIISTKFITVAEFIRVGMGKQTSRANDIGTNLFEKYGVKECLYKYDSTDCKNKNGMNIHDLWTLRYNRNPNCPPNCFPTPTMIVEGYSQHKSHPSWPQLQILQQYGIIYINDFFYGENLFKLFVDFQKNDWLSIYQNSTE